MTKVIPPVKTFLLSTPPCAIPAVCFELCHDVVQICDRRFKFGDRLGGQVLGFRQVVGVLDGVVLEPGDVEFVVSILYFADVEFPETSIFTQVFAFAPAVWVLTIALLEFRKVLGCQRAFLFIITAGR